MNKNNKKNNQGKWLVGFLIVALLIAAATLNRGQSYSRVPAAKFADGKPTGGKGLALLLNKIGYQSKVQDAPIRQIPTDARAWLLLDPDVSFTKREGQQLLDWVKTGGVLIYCVQRGETVFSFIGGDKKKPVTNGPQTVAQGLGLSPESGFSVYTRQSQSNSQKQLPDLPAVAFDVPSNVRTGVKTAFGDAGDFGIERDAVAVAGAPGGTIARLPYGKGQVWAIPNAWMLTNYGLSKPDTAVLVTNLLRTQAPPVGARKVVYFDERNHDETERPPVPDTLINRLKRPPISTAILQLLFAGVLLWIFASRRLGTAVPLPTSGPVTRASQFAQAMGALFAKTSRPAAAADIIGQDFRKRLASRLGMSPTENDAVLARRAHELSGVPYEVVDRLLLQTRTPAHSEAQALRDAQEMNAVLERLEGR